MMKKMLYLITNQGKSRLGGILKKSRESNGWSLDDLIRIVEERTGHKLAKSTISSLERGNVSPRWDTLAILSASKYVSVNGKVLSPPQMIDIACGGSASESPRQVAADSTSRYMNAPT